MVQKKRAWPLASVILEVGAQDPGPDTLIVTSLLLITPVPFPKGMYSAAKVKGIPLMASLFEATSANRNAGAPLLLPKYAPVEMVLAGQIRDVQSGAFSSLVMAFGVWPLSVA